MLCTYYTSTIGVDQWTDKQIKSCQSGQFLKMTWDFIDKENFNRPHTKIRYNLNFIEQLTTQKEVDKQIGKRVRKMAMLLHNWVRSE